MPFNLTIHNQPSSQEKPVQQKVLFSCSSFPAYWRKLRVGLHYTQIFLRNNHFENIKNPGENQEKKEKALILLIPSFFISVFSQLW
jgi:hypothetical protein